MSVRSEKVWRDTWAVYVLRLSNNCFYVGCTTSSQLISERIANNDIAKRWLAINPVIEIAYVYKPNRCKYSDLINMRNRLSVRLALAVGDSRVRGGKLSGYYTEPAPLAWCRFYKGVIPLNYKELFKSHSQCSIRQRLISTTFTSPT